jgi:hypothetical protein
MRGREEALLNWPSKESHDGMDGQKGRGVDNEEGRKVRTSQRLEDKLKIGLYDALRHNVRFRVNGKMRENLSSA